MYKSLVASILSITLALVMSIPTSAAQIPVLFPWTVCAITNTTPTVCTPNTGSPVTLYLGATNNSSISQAATITCYDNASAATGSVAVTIPPMGPGQVYSETAPGRPLNFGLTCQSSGTINGTAVELKVR